MSIKIKKRNDDVFEVAVVASVSNAYEVTVTDQSLSDLTDKMLRRSNCSGSLLISFWKENQTRLPYRQLI